MGNGRIIAVPSRASLVKHHELRAHGAIVVKRADENESQSGKRCAGQVYLGATVRAEMGSDGVAGIGGVGEGLQFARKLKVVLVVERDRGGTCAG